MKPDGYYERPVNPVVVVAHMGPDGVQGARGRDGRSGHRQPGENAAHGQHGTPAGSGNFIDAHLEGLNPTIPEAGVAITVRQAKTEIPLPVATGTTDELAIISVRGGHGGRGGNGGNGGHGDMGTGDGGRGGSGGAAGHGGFCRVTTANPYLLMLLRVDLRPGIAGSGGDGGSGSPGGAGGPVGPSGEYGGAEYAILSPDGATLEESVTPYHLQVLTYDIIDDMNDNILEPGEGVTITNVQLMNAGGLTLPSGARFQFCNTDTITFEAHDVTIGSLAPGQALTLPQVFKAKIHDVPEPVAPGPFHGNARYPTSSSLLNRQFQQGSIWTNMHTQYPVIISKMGYPQQMARGDKSELRVGVKNVSTRAYGLDDLTKVTVRISVHPFFAPQVPQFAVGPDGMPFVDFIVQNLEPGTEQVVPLPVELLQGGPELYDRYPWKAELILRTKKIELDTAVIRCAPKWEEYIDTNAEVVLFAGHHWSRGEYLLWMKMMETCAIEAQIWDFDYYRGISFDLRSKKRHPESWTVDMLAEHQPHKRTLIFPVGNVDQLKTLVMDDIYKHFMTYPTLTELAVTTTALDEHGVIIFGLDDKETRTQLMWSGMDFDLSKHFKDSMFGKADEKDAKNKANSLLKKLNATEFFHKISTLKIQPVNTGGRSWTFGEMRVKRCAFRKNSRIQCIPNPILGFLDQKGLPDGVLDMNSNFGSFFFHLVASLPLRVRFHMMMKAPAFVNNYKIVRRSNDEHATKDCSLLDFMMLLCYQEVRTDFVIKDKQRPKLEALTVLLESNPELYKNAADVLTVVLYVFKRAHKKAKFGDKSAEKRKDRVKTAIWGKNYKKEATYNDYDKRADKAIDAHSKKIKITSFLTTPNGSLIYDLKD
jgi:hypothetical protein